MHQTMNTVMGFWISDDNFWNSYICVYIVINYSICIRCFACYIEYVYRPCIICLHLVMLWRLLNF